MRSTLSIILLLAFTQGILFAQKETEYRQIGSISGRSFTIIQAALNGAKISAQKISKYKITIEESAESYRVTFEDPNRPAMMAGSSPNMAEFYIELRKDTLQFIKTTFYR